VGAQEKNPHNIATADRHLMTGTIKDNVRFVGERLPSVIVPSHANVTVPPPAIAARKLDSVQLVTTPPAWAGSTSKIPVETIVSVIANEMILKIHSPRLRHSNGCM
jgi:hypothetical protein